MAVGRLTFSKAEREKLAAILWLLNWISVVTGSFLLSLGLFLKVELQRWQEVMVEPGVLYVPHVLISTGLAACGINFLGGRICLDCTDTHKFLRWKLVLAPYVGCTFFFTSCILAGALMCYGVHSQLEESLSLGLRTAMRYYKDTDTPGRCSLKKTVDLLQLQFQCCGNSGYRDWTRIQWISSRYLNLSSSAVRDRLRSNVEGQYLVDGVPFSCCSTLSPRPCIQQQLSNGSAHFNYDQRSQQLNLWSRGCRQALLDHYTGLLRFTGLAVLLVWLFELLVLTGVRYLQTAMENVILLGDPDSESDGWILENSLAETARSNFNVIKNLGKCYQVDDDPNINVPTVSKEREVPSSRVQKVQVVPSPQVQEIQEVPSPKVKEVQDALSPEVEKIQDVSSSQVEEVEDAPPPQVEEVQDAPPLQVEEVQDAPPPQVEEVQDAPSPQVEEVQDAPPPQVEEVQDAPPPQVEEVQDAPPPQVEEVQDAPPLEDQVPETS